MVIYRTGSQAGGIPSYFPRHVSLFNNATIALITALQAMRIHGGDHHPIRLWQPAIRSCGMA